MLQNHRFEKSTEPSAFPLLLGMSDQNFYEENGVHYYDPSRDREGIVDVALEHMNELASDYKDTSESRERFLQEEIAPVLDSDGVNLIVLVYRHQGRTIGFIDYTMKNPWHRSLLPYKVGPNAHVNHLAVATQYHGNGYGTQLFKTVLQDCEKNEVNRVTLSTTSWVSRLDLYYRKFGFSIVRECKYTGAQYLSRRLKPHPIIVGAVHMMNWLHRLK